MPPTVSQRGGPSGLKRGPAAPVGRKSTGGKTVLGRGKMSMGLGGKLGAKRHRKIVKDTIIGITKPAIRRLARRGGVKRISAQIYDDVRQVIKSRLEMILRNCIAYTEYRRVKTVTVKDVVFALKNLGTPIYGFDDNYAIPKRGNAASRLGRGEEDD